MRRRHAALAVALVALPAALAVGAVGTLTLVGGDDAPTFAAVLSGDGDWVVVATAAPLTGIPTGGQVQLYARNLRDARTVLVSASARGAPANAGVDADAVRPQYAVSVDGRYVAFASRSTNLLALDPNGPGRDVFRKDLVSGAVALVSVGIDGRPPRDGVLGQPDISGDGNRVAFATGAATSLVPRDSGPSSDVVVRDVLAQETILASVDADERQAAGAATAPAISADGRVVAFEIDGAAANLVPGDTDGAAEIVVRDLAAGETRAIGPGEGTLAAVPSLGGISGDGRALALETAAAYEAGDANAVADVYLARPFGGVRPRLVSGAVGRAGNGASTRPSLSADGGRVAFLSTATDLVAGDLNGGAADVLVAGGPALLRESARTDGVQHPGGAQAPDLAGSGATLVFSYDDALGPFLAGDADRLADAIVRERLPSDATGPALAAGVAPAGPGAASRRRVIAGTVTDPSGVVSLTVGGRRARLDAAGRFGVAITRSGTVGLIALDGAGNRTERTVAVAPPSPAAYSGPQGGAGRTPIARQVRIEMRPRAVVARFALESGAPVRVIVDRRDASGGWDRIGVRARRLPAGAHRVVVPIEAGLRGLVRVRVLTYGSGVRQVARLATITSSRR